MKNKMDSVSRRQFLIRSAACVAGVSLLPLIPSQLLLADELKIKKYNILGRTGLKVSDIGLGAGGTTDPSVIDYALDLGINYFDTAEGYGQGKSEETVGKVAKTRRDKMVICTKLGMDGNTKQEDVLTRFEDCLKRMQTTYADVLMVHSGNKDALDNDNILEAFTKLKKDGKIKFTGVSHHGPNLTTELKPVIEKNFFDVFLVSYDPDNYADYETFLKATEEKKIGMVAMKVVSSAQKEKLEEFTSGKFPFHHAAVRRVLREPRMHTSILSMNIMDQVEEFVKMSGPV